MSKQNSTPEPEMVFPSPDRILLALEASWEADSCAYAVLEMHTRLNVACDEVRAMRSLVIRLRDLSGIVMAALGDDGADTAEMRETITGLPAHHLQDASQ